MKPFKVTVQAHHIADAIKGDSSHCMIADTIRDLYPDLKRIAVDLQTIRFSLDDKRYVFLTPPVAQEKLLDFDQGADVAPFEFHLRRPAQITKTKGRNTRASAKVVGAEHGKAPIVLGGMAPPIAPLSGEAGNKRHGSRADLGATSGNKRTGRMRRFGLRSMGR